MNTNNIFFSLLLLVSLSFLVSCATSTEENPAVDLTDNTTNVVSVETSAPTIKVDSAKIKEMVAEKEAELAAAATAEKEKLALEAKKEAKAEKERLAELKRKKAVADKKKAAAAAAAQASIAASELPVSKPVIKPAAPKPASKPAPKKGAKISFTTKTHNFGTIKEGDVVKYEFEYTNTGTEELVIKDATATCGCTAPGFSFFPLAPGLSSAISVTFNSANKAGAQRPEVTIFTNGYPSKHVLTLEGTVE